MSHAEQLARLKRVNPRAELWDEGGPLVFLPGQKVRHGKSDIVLDALLAPRAHSSYTTRLFLDRPFPNRGQNWTVHTVGGRIWHTMSYNLVPETLSWTEILANHLGQLK